MALDPRLEHVETTVRGRYLVRDAQTGANSALLVGFHGYGETAENHLAELERIPGSAGWKLIAVQALHPFYKSSTGEVVASWMTRLDRQSAIEDNVGYVANVLRRESSARAAGGALVFAGFSQGTAMAYRAAAGAQLPCHGIVALGGDFPPELATRDLQRFPPVLIGRGDRDEWYTQEKLSHDLEVLAAKGIATSVSRFAGGHEWTDEFRSACGDFLDRVRRSATPRSQ